MQKTTTNDAPLEIASDVITELADTGRQLEWAEDEIQQAMQRHPSHRDRLYHSLRLLTPTRMQMRTEFVFRSHCRELLERVVADADTRPGTAAEECCVCCDSSLIAPLRSPAAGLYLRMWKTAFPDKPVFVDSGQHHEALEGSTIDDLEAATRRKLTVANRELGTITCAGRHHGETVQCTYARARFDQTRIVAVATVD